LKHPAVQAVPLAQLRMIIKIMSAFLLAAKYFDKGVGMLMYIAIKNSHKTN
jgi:hypothetical protein